MSRIRAAWLLAAWLLVLVYGSGAIVLAAAGGVIP